MLFEVSFVRLQHAIEPRQQLFGAMVRMSNDWDSIRSCNRSDIMSPSYRSNNTCLLFAIVQAFTGKISSSTIRKLDDYRRFAFSGCFKCCIDRGSRSAVECWNGKSML